MNPPEVLGATVTKFEPFLTASNQAALPRLKAAGWGRVVNIASAAVLTAPPTMVPHVASKTGVVGFTRALASVLGPYDITVKITVKAIAPSMVRTPTAERTVGADGGFAHGRDQQAVPRPRSPATWSPRRCTSSTRAPGS